MDDFRYQDARLYCEDVAVGALAEQYGTPLYVYSKRTLVNHYVRIRDAFAELDPVICYSIKSCHNLHILKVLSDCGSSFDVVSGGELRRALEVTDQAQRIVFAGVGKTDEEIRFALERGVGWFNVESEQELGRIDRLACEVDRQAVIALRVNPDVDPQTHPYTTTGKAETKFGIDAGRALSVFEEYRSSRHLKMSAIHLHLGSPVTRTQAYAEAIETTLGMIDELRKIGCPIDTLNIGGGFGAHYEGGEAPPATEYAAVIVPRLREKNLRLILEPGRSISANAGILVGKVLYLKYSGRRRFVIVDAAMTELIRPALYGAYHFVWPVHPPAHLVPPHRGRDLQLANTMPVDVVGPVCESGDFLAKDRHLPAVNPGDYLAVFSAGAYGSVMGSRYNSRPLAAEVLVDGPNHRLIRRRESFEDMVALERACN